MIPHMQHGQYWAEITYEPDAEMFHGRTMNVMHGGFDFWGSSVEELRREFATSAQVFEEFCKEEGLDPLVVQPEAATV
ncbi:MAG: type II toxin-antitoxin system HicB family antitoxin [Gemmatimonadetes bacterium]|nr:type II toxin-antitoxin system HicB family antitoxin [Gemmatimonadota bacterium]